jgi:succinyl-CoA:acetate CoA-transferase
LPKCAVADAKGGTISSIVPLASHMDHGEHSVQVVVTEQGVADCAARTRTIAPVAGGSV